MCQRPLPTALINEDTPLQNQLITTNQSEKHIEVNSAGRQARSSRKRKFDKKQVVRAAIVIDIEREGLKETTADSKSLLQLQRFCRILTGLIAEAAYNHPKRKNDKKEEEPKPTNSEEEPAPRHRRRKTQLSDEEDEKKKPPKTLPDSSNSIRAPEQPQEKIPKQNDSITISSDKEEENSSPARQNLNKDKDKARQTNPEESKYKNLEGEMRTSNHLKVE